MPRSEWPDVSHPPDQCWHSRHFLVQIYIKPKAIRISISRVSAYKDGEWKNKIEWEELQTIKSDIGYGNRVAVEIYPKDCDIVNLHNMRHLWIATQELDFGLNG